MKRKDNNSGFFLFWRGVNGIPRYRHDEKATDESFKEVIVKYITLIIGNASIVFSKTMEAFLYDYGSLSSSQAIQSLSVLLIYASQQSVSEPFLRSADQPDAPHWQPTTRKHDQSPNLHPVQQAYHCLLLRKYSAQ